MSTEASIVVKGNDQYTSVVKRMMDHTAAFSKKTELLQKGLETLSRTKIDLKFELKAAKTKLKEAEDAFNGLQNAANRFKLETEQANYDNIVRNLKAVTHAQRDLEKAASTIENKATGGGFAKAFDSIKNSAALNQYGQMLATAIGQSAGSHLTSSLGSDIGGAIGTTVGGIASGAAIGFSVGGPIGAAIGSGVGLISGGISAFTEIFEKKDDFFKDYYGNLYEERISAGESALTAGSTTAGSREQSYKAFEKRLGTAEADAYLSQVKSMAAQTNYGYDEILGYSKLLLNSYNPEETFGLLTTLSDATAGLNLSSGDVEMFIKGFSRMRTTGKVTQEYLNYFSERGVDVYEALAQGSGVDKSQIADMVTQGKIKGADAAEYIVEFLNESYGGLSKELMGTYDAQKANLADVQANVEEGYGTGYNEERKSALDDMTKTLDGKLGEKLTWVNEASGFAKGYAENMKDYYWMDVMEAVFNGDTELREGVAFNKEVQAKVDQYSSDYLMAKFRYDNAKTEEEKAKAGLDLERIKQQAEVLAGEAFGASGINQDVIDSQKTLAEETKTLANAFGTWAALYGLNQTFTEGQASAEDIFTGYDIEYYPVNDPSQGGFGGGNGYVLKFTRADPNGHAAGLNHVPYDNYPALLHQGERVLTAQQAREADRGQGVSVVISGNEFHIREDADVDRVAEALLQKLELAAVRG